LTNVDNLGRNFSLKTVVNPLDLVLFVVILLELGNIVCLNYKFEWSRFFQIRLSDGVKNFVKKEDFCSRSEVRVERQHLLEQVDEFRIGVREHLRESGLRVLNGAFLYIFDILQNNGV
jgi:hypothetical protein